MKTIIVTIRKANGSEIVKEFPHATFDFRAVFNDAERKGDRITHTRHAERAVIDFD